MRMHCTLHTFLHLQLLALGGAFGCAAPAALGCQFTANRPTFHAPRAEIPNLSPRSFQLLSKQQTPATRKISSGIFPGLSPLILAG